MTVIGYARVSTIEQNLDLQCPLSGGKGPMLTILAAFVQLKRDTMTERTRGTTRRGRG